MPENMQELFHVVIRSSGFLTPAFVLVWCLLKYLRIQSSRVHAAAWPGVLLHGVILMPLQIELAVIAPPEPDNEFTQHSPDELSRLLSVAGTTAQCDSSGLIDETYSRLIMTVLILLTQYWIA